MDAEQSARAERPVDGPRSVDGPVVQVGVHELESLFESYGAACFGLARHILRDAELAQDAVREAFVEHWRDATSDATRSTHRSRLLRLTHRKVVDRVRHEGRRRSSPLEAAADQQSTWRGPEDPALAGVQALKVRAALATVPGAQREALELAYWGGFTQREIAELTQVPLCTVRTRMRNGMVCLREALANGRLAA